jgi:hypothetical protein
VAGRDKNSNCAGCHGIPGWRTAYPKVYSPQHPRDALLGESYLLIKAYLAELRIRLCRGLEALTRGHIPKATWLISSIRHQVDNAASWSTFTILSRGSG